MTATRLKPEIERRLIALAQALVDQQAARQIVPPCRNAPGFWFGGGSLTLAADGTLWLSGRYRNYGDSRHGLAAGERGLECAIFASRDGGGTFTRIRSWSKADLSGPLGRVISIEGTALRFAPDGTCEFFVSSEKDTPYPEPMASYRKPGTGVWSIDVLRGRSVQDLAADSLTPVFPQAPTDLACLHLKDPKVFDTPAGDTVLLFCSHPYCWTSSNAGWALRRRGETGFRLQSSQLLERGPAWDVAVTRVTNRLPVPRLGAFAELPPLSVFFYDGAECVRQHEESVRGVSRPRGYSCEELGGLAYGFDAEFPALNRLSVLQPLFVSPFGTGCSRYVDAAFLGRDIVAAWQQSQADGSQPLVAHRLAAERIAQLLS